MIQSQYIRSVLFSVIPAQAAKTLRWLDDFYTDEGTLFYHMGIEGAPFYKTADGRLSARDLRRMQKGNKAFDDIIAQYLSSR